MRKPLALVAACCVLAGTQSALADGGSNSTYPVSTGSCTPLKKIYSEKNWRERNPQRGHRACSVRRKAGAQNTVRHFKEYRTYRQIATMKCTGGSEGWFVPNPGSCSTIACESGFSWSAYNPSGAVGPYQLLGWGAPFPVHGFRDRLEHHILASRLSRSAWVC